MSENQNTTRENVGGRELGNDLIEIEIYVYLKKNKILKNMKQQLFHFVTKIMAKFAISFHTIGIQ